jgi:phenylalanyl-tRNA synthetase beta chain
MRFSERWLREWTDPPVDADGLVAQLTGAGLEVDSAEPAGPPLERVVVARVVHTQPHPDADALTLCRVDAGAGEPLAIVCGAPNVRVGLMAPLALPGARLPGDVPVEARPVRGQISHGMLCSRRELGIGEDAAGLLELEPDMVPGTALCEALGLDDTCIDVDLTPNRGDCLYLEGIARDVAAVNGDAVAHRAVPAVPAGCDATFPVHLEAPAACPRYVGRVIRGVDATARTPLWMVERLRRSGVRSLGPVVDVTNYVMLELGHPMHAFDLERLRGAIRVRHAQPGENVALLDESTHALCAADLVIADQEGAVALAGIMGGLASAVGDATRDVFLECAWFEPRGIGQTARRLGLHTDASHRFERFVNPQGQVRATERATALLTAIVGGEAGPLVDTAQTTYLPTREGVGLRAERLQRLLGMEVPAPKVRRILESLHFTVEDRPDGWQVTPPPFRPDISREADLIEEVARIQGYASVPDVAPVARLEMAPRPESRGSLRALRRRLVARGYQEAITYSFVDAGLQARMERDVEPMALANPISADLAVMRTSLLPGLLQAATYNHKRQQGRVRLFESGLVYRAEEDGTAQPAMLGGVALGNALPVQWGEPVRAVDFYDVKADVEALFGPRENALDFRPCEHPALHPGQAARVWLDGRDAGVVGSLHPSIARAVKIGAPVVLFELALDAVLDLPLPSFQEFSRHPAVLRDLAVVVDESVDASKVLDCVGQAAGDVLKKLELFDVYRGEGVDSGRKSLALSLTFQSPSRTLDEAEVEASVSAILRSLAEDLGGKLRG